MKAAEFPHRTAILALDEVEYNARIRRGFEQLIVPSASRFLADVSIMDEQKREFIEYIKLKGADASVNYRGLYILECSIFEYFCKQLIRNMVEEISTSSSDFEGISNTLIAANYAYTGLYFSKNRDGYISGTDRQKFERYSENLVTCRERSSRVRLNAEVFVESLGNCTPTQLEARFKELGLEPPFNDKIAGFPELKRYFGSSRTRSIAKSARAELEEMIARRNRIVHSSAVSETVTFDQIIGTKQFIYALIGAIKAKIDAI